MIYVDQFIFECEEEDRKVYIVIGLDEIACCLLAYIFNVGVMVES